MTSTTGTKKPSTRAQLEADIDATKTFIEKCQRLASELPNSPDRQNDIDRVREISLKVKELFAKLSSVVLTSPSTAPVEKRKASMNYKYTDVKFLQLFERVFNVQLPRVTNEVGIMEFQSLAAKAFPLLMNRLKQPHDVLPNSKLVRVPDLVRDFLLEPINGNREDTYLARWRAKVNENYMKKTTHSKNSSSAVIETRYNQNGGEEIFCNPAARKVLALIPTLNKCEEGDVPPQALQQLKHLSDIIDSQKNEIKKKEDEEKLRRQQDKLAEKQKKLNLTTTHLPSTRVDEKSSRYTM